MQRESVTFPADMMKMEDGLLRLSRYIEQMEILWQAAPEFDLIADLWGQVGQKFEHYQEIENGLKVWLARIQLEAPTYTWGDRLVRKLWRQSMVAVFLRPVMAFRNAHQSLLFHPFRIELFRLFFQPLPAELKELGQIYFDTFTSQLGGLRRDWLRTGEHVNFLLDPINRLADSLSLYGLSDNVLRLWSFNATLNKVNRATEVYLKSNRTSQDVARWVKQSGTRTLRPIEQNYVLTHFLANPDRVFNLGIEGLQSVTGANMANFWVAERIATVTHFPYRRPMRGLIEMGALGETLWNLAVFPRGYAQRLYFQAEKIRDVFRGEATWDEARGGFNDIMKLMVAGMFFSQYWAMATGRKRNPYDPLGILSGWQFGGLFVGVAQDLTEVFRQLVIAVNPLSDEESRNKAMAILPTLVERLSKTCIPFYENALDTWEAFAPEKIGGGVEGRGAQDALRKLRALFDKEYTPEDLDKLNMDLWDKIRKAIIGYKQPDLAELQKIQEDIQEAEDLLGTQDITGRYFTLRQLGGTIKSSIRGIPPDMLDPELSFSSLTLFYVECEDTWKDFFLLPSTPSSVRKQARLSDPELEAKLLFWGKYNTSVFPAGSSSQRQVAELLDIWFQKYNIDQSMHPSTASWFLPPEED